MRLPNRWRWIVLASVLVLGLWMSGALATGLDWAEGRLQKFGFIAEPRERPDGAHPRREGDNQREIPVIQPPTVLVFETRFIPCDLEARAEFPADPSQVGQSREQFRMYHPEWSVVEFSAERVVARREIAGRCEELLKQRTIKLRDGRVTIFFGDGGPHSPIMAQTDIRADELVAGDRERFTQGVVVSSDEEAWMILEGLKH